MYLIRPMTMQWLYSDTIAKFRTNIRLQTVELNPLFVDDKLIGTMEQAGFVGIGITIESAADPVLERLKKGFTARDVYKTSEVIQHHKIPCLCKVDTHVRWAW